MSDLVPEEAIEAIARALCTDHGHSRQDGGMNCRTCSRRARVAAEAAAPLILAAELVRLADEAGRTERSVRAFGVTDYSEGKADGVNRTLTGSSPSRRARSAINMQANDPAAVLRLCQSHRDIVAMFPVSEPHLDTHGSFYGFQARDCGEHRTVGPHRAWCFDCSEWCYPNASCRRCHGVHEVIIALARGYGIEDGETK